MTVQHSCLVCGAALAARATCCSSCGASVVSSCPAAAWPSGFLLAQRYQMVQRIGQGGFATVYKARDRQQRNRVVAIKQIHLEGLSLKELIDASDTYNREVTHLSKLRDKNLPRIYDHFTDDQHWYIVMEYLEGQTLDQAFSSSRRGYFSVKQVLDMGITLCSVFQHLHSQQPPIIFRDVKPENIMITPNGQLYLIDFGIARLCQPGRKDTGPLGTPGYAAPEQYGRRAYTTPRTDIYGLGATLQTLLTGQDPLEVAQNGIEPERARAIPRRLQDLLIRMMASDARARPRNMDEVRQELQAIKDGFRSQKARRFAIYVGEAVKNTSPFARVFLFAFLLIDVFSLVGFIWQPLWLLPLLLLVLIACVRILFKLYQLRKEGTTKLETQELIEMVWRQITGSVATVLLLTILAYYLYTIYQDWGLYGYGLNGDGVVLLLVLGGAALVVGGAVLAGLFLVMRHFWRTRAGRKPRVQTAPLQQQRHP